jgi:hypothetical protein
MLPPVETDMPKHTNASSREPTGGLTRCEGAVGLERSGLAERGNVPQSRDRGYLWREICQSLAALPVQGESKKRHARKTAAQKERVPLAWFCNNPARDDRATSTALNRSTSSPVPASWWHRSRRHTPREQLRVPPERMVWLETSLTNLDGEGVRVKQARAPRKDLTLDYTPGCNFMETSE